mgnify:CR=1 FL=1
MRNDVDPVSENVAASMGRPVYVLPKQDHVAHIQTHLAFLKSPVFGMNPSIVKSYLYPMAMHLRDHLLNFYLTQAHEAVQRAEREQLITSDSEQQVKVIVRVQQIIEQQLAQFAQELAKIDAALKSLGVADDQALFEPSIVRGLEYYTGAVFEAELLLQTTDDKGQRVSFGSIGGGGRYDDLVARFTGQRKHIDRLSRCPSAFATTAMVSLTR